MEKRLLLDVPSLFDEYDVISTKMGKPETAYMVESFRRLKVDPNSRKDYDNLMKLVRTVAKIMKSEGHKIDPDLEEEEQEILN